MGIKIKTKESISEDRLIDLKNELDRLQNELIDQIKDSISDLASLDVLYDLRDYIENLITNWVDEDIEI
jgi:ribosomal protein S13